ncbi:unnamed protein product [Phytophthora fragariaefolia]|uniref:Unnamed protein product n=1 Tax=Phytophthora fragariaefolia TaxID=1490495 RepID=A0A9W6XC83_9STRA|nr:unnamed protein product [Phytophthora fragariaefolia]
MEAILDANLNGFVLENANAYRSMSVLDQIWSSPITVQEKKKTPPTTVIEIMTVLPLRRIESCESQVAIFQNRWYSDYETKIPHEHITVKSGRYVFGVQMLKAMRSWHVAIPRLLAMEEIIKWMDTLDLGGWNPEDSWKTECLDVDEVIDSLRQVDVLGYYFWLTTLRGKKSVDLSCMDLCLRGLMDIYSVEHVVYAIPSHVLRFPVFDHKTVHEKGVWMKLRSALEIRSGTGECQQKEVCFFAVIYYNAEHWCAAAVNFAEYSITIFDPQQTGDRFAALRTYLRAELVPLLPIPPSPKRYSFKQVDWVVQLDTYNCGLFVVLFFELLLLGVVPEGAG